MARPLKKIDLEQVKKLARLGCTQDEIADFLGVDQATISRRFASEVVQARAACKISIRRAQLISGTRKFHPNMLIHLGKHFLGQSDKPESDAHALFDDVLDPGAEVQGGSGQVPE